MITPSFGLTATERVLPRLALDWTTGIAQPGVDVTRAGVATFVGSNGLIQSATADTQRIDYSTGVAGLLVEESRTNIALHSEAFNNWATKIGATVSTETTDFPDGATSGDMLTATAGAGNHYVRQDIACSAIAYTFSAYLKKTNQRYIILADRGDAVWHVATFDFDTGTVSGQTNSTATMVDAGNGWYRCAMTFTRTNAGSVQASVSFAQASANASLPSFTAVGDETVYAWGAQLEAGAFATSYIPTEATALTRNADLATMTGTNFSDWFNPTEGTFVAWGTQQSETDGIQRRGFANISDGANSNRMGLATVQFNVVIGGSSVVNQTFSGFVPDQLYKSVAAYKLNNCQFASNGSLSSTDTSSAIPTVDRVQLGRMRAADGLMSGHLQKFLYYPQRLTSAELQAIST